MSLRRHGRKLAFIDLEVGGETASKGTAAQAMLNLASLTSDGKPLPDDAIKNLFTKLQRGDWIGEAHNQIILVVTDAPPRRSWTSRDE